jgi:Acetyltransferases
VTQDRWDRELRIRPASPEDARDVLAIWMSAAEWLRDRGIDQWNPSQFSLEAAAAAIRNSEVYLAELGHEAAGTYLLAWSDVLIWKELDNAESGYIHRLAVRRDLKGMGLGLRLLRHAERQIAGRGKRFIRLDCMADNERLNRYYRDAGYTRVGRSDGDGWSANLYEKRAATI